MSALSILRRPQTPAIALPTVRRVVHGSGMIIVLAVVSLVVPWRSTRSWWVDIALVAVLLVAIAAAVADVNSARIPDRLIVAALLPSIAVLMVDVGSDRSGVAVGGVLCGIAGFAMPVLVVHLVAPRALGFGDVKLAGVLGASIGLVDWRLTVVALCIASGLTAVVAIARRRSAVPFAPGLVVGSVIVLLVPILEGAPTWP